MKTRQQLRRIAVETALILILSLLLSLVYNAVSPTGLRILPKKGPQEKQAIGRGILLSRSPMVLP